MVELKWTVFLLSALFSHENQTANDIAVEINWESRHISKMANKIEIDRKQVEEKSQTVVSRLQNILTLFTLTLVFTWTLYSKKNMVYDGSG